MFMNCYFKVIFNGTLLLILRSADNSVKKRLTSNLINYYIASPLLLVYSLHISYSSHALPFTLPFSLWCSWVICAVLISCVKVWYSVTLLLSQ